MKLVTRLAKLEARLAERTTAATLSAGEIDHAAEAFNRRINTLRERYLADPESYLPWEQRSSAEKWATAETVEQWVEAKALLEEGLARAKENQRRGEEQVRQYQAIHRKRPGQYHYC